MIELAAIALIFAFGAVGILSNRLSVNGLGVIAITGVMALVQEGYVVVTGIITMFLMALVVFAKTRGGY